MKNWSKFTLAIAFLATYAMSAPSIWNGMTDVSWYESSAQAYNLTTAEQLAGLAQLVNDGTSDFSGKTITVGADIFLNDTTGAGDGSWVNKSHRAWTPIGTQSTPFKGEFDGLAGKKNRKIYGLYINDSTKNYVGLFGYTNGVKISNLDLQVGSINGRNNVGALIGYALGGTLENVHSELNVTGKDTVGGLAGTFPNVDESSVNADVKGRNYVGGIIGVVLGTLTNCSYRGFVYGNNYVGGIAAKAGDLYSTYQNLVIQESSAEGRVKGDSNYIGGLIGYANGGVKNSHSKNSVEGNDYVGGIVGQQDYKYSVSHVTATDYFDSYEIDSVFHTDGVVVGKKYVGGLLGFVQRLTLDFSTSSDYSRWRNGNTRYGTSRWGIGGVINKSYVISDVRGEDYVGGVAGWIASVAKSYFKGNVDGDDYVGGLAGYTSSVNESYSIGNTSGRSEYVGGLAGQADKIKMSNSTSIVKGKRYVGGLAGKCDSVFSSFYKSSAPVLGDSYVGGLVGQNKAIDDSYSNANVNGSLLYIGGLAGKTRKILSSYSRGNVYGMDSVGGLAGVASYQEWGLISNSYHIGNVQGRNCVGGLACRVYGNVDSSFAKQGVVKGENTIGGLIGYVDGSINYSFADLSFVSAGSNLVGGLVGFAKQNIVDSYCLTDSVQGRDSIGGLAGIVGGYVAQSYAVVSYISGNNSVGGLAGLVSANVSKSYFFGDSVIGIYQVGGLVGVANGLVDSSYSTANVKGDDNVGGLIGSSRGNISNSYALGNVVGDVDHSSAGNDNLGGLVGYAYKGSISKSLAKGNVGGTTKLGGLVGRFDGTSITQSYANGNVIGNYYGDPADEVGNFYIGGLVGYAKGTLSESYASGIVKGMDEDPVYTGCLIGYVDGSLTMDDSYYDNEKCSLGIEGMKGSKTAGATITNSSGKTTAEMQDEMTFANWDFVDTWSILDKNYPFLIHFVNSFVNVDVTTESLKNMVYDGEAKTPTVTKVELGGIILTENTDYQVNYQNNIDAGMASIKVCGLGVYSGCKIIPFTIAPISLKISLGKIENQVYDSFEKTPTVSIYEGETLLEDLSYSMVFTNNVNAGTAIVEVSLTGNYSGSASATFTIEKAKSVIEKLPVAREIFYGQTLEKSSLEGGSANIEGTFVWSKTDIVPDPFNNGYEVTFVPDDAENYLGAKGIVPLVVKKCVVSFMYEGSVLQLDSLMYGDVPQFDGDLPKKNSAQYEYTFKTWSPKIVAATGNQTYVAVFDSILQKYTVNFYNGDSLLQSSEIEYGTTPTLKGANPKKTMSEGYSYTFKGWSPKVVTVTDNANYFAVYDSTIRTYTVSFMNGSMTLKTMTLEYGSVPNYTAKPSKASSEKYKYTFAGWSPKVDTVRGDVKYQAVYDSVTRYYIVRFVNGTDVLQKDSVAYGDSAKYRGKTPEKTASKMYEYKFIGWSPKLGAVTKQMDYVAVFDSTKLTGILASRQVNSDLLINVNSRNIQITAAPVGKIYALFDMQGRVLQKGRVESVNYNIVAPCAGSYFIRIGSQTRAVEVK